LVVSLASAGHPRPLVVTPGGDIHEIAVHGRFCGALRSTTYMEVQVKLGRGDLLLLVGDGVVDAKGSQGRFGADRLARLAAGYRGAEPAALAAAVDLAVTEYAATCPGEPTGDTAVVVIGAEPG
jgi:serine phosphatase RsbU (regulator of sigma subunit)